MYDALFRPLELNKLTLPNRIVRSAHTIGKSGEHLIAYHEARAKGGVGLSILGAAGVHATSAMPEIPVYNDSVLDLYTEISERCNAHGMRVFQQLNHHGSAYSGAVTGMPLWSSSAVPNPRSGTVPRPMPHDVIQEMTTAFGEAASRCRAGGLDGVEIHAGHSYLLSQFLSPVLNQRTDDYGGPLENRMRFLLEVIAEVRRAVGSDYPVGVRIVGDEFIDGGLRVPESREIARRLEVEPIDFIDVSQGGYWRFDRLMGTSDLPLGYELEASEAVTRVVSLPTIVTGRIMTLEAANHVVESGQADLVSMVRATIADPELVSKARAGRESEIRPCVGTNQGCVGGLATGTFGCVTNALAGREFEIATESAPAMASKRVLVIGGGPAGMEAARVSALRGHSVHLHERSRELGGQLVAAGSVRERADLSALTRWLEDELRRLNVRISLRSLVDPDVVRRIGADEVIVATGGSATKDRPQTLAPSMSIPGHERPHVLTSWDVLRPEARAKIGPLVLIFDDTGSFEALTVALGVVDRCSSLTVICRHEFLAAKVAWPAATVGSARANLLRHNVTVRPMSRLLSIDDDHVIVSWTDTERSERLPADTVIICGHHEPNRDLPDALTDAGISYHLVGDVNGSQDLQRAVAEANAVARLL